MNLVCFDAYTAGDLVTNLLNNKKATILNGVVSSSYNCCIFKIDSTNVIANGKYIFGKDLFELHPSLLDYEKKDITIAYNDEINAILWNHSVNKYRGKFNGQWFSTHFSPYKVPLITNPLAENFDRVIVITTDNKLSRYSKFLRLCYNISYVDYNEDQHIEFYSNFLTNSIENTWTGQATDSYEHIEFNDIVTGKFVADNNLDRDYYEIWKRQNSFLFETQSYDLKLVFETQFDHYEQNKFMLDTSGFNRLKQNTFRQFYKEIKNWLIKQKP